VYPVHLARVDPWFEVLNSDSHAHSATILTAHYVHMQILMMIVRACGFIANKCLRAPV